MNGQKGQRARLGAAVILALLEVATLSWVDGGSANPAPPIECSYPCATAAAPLLDTISDLAPALSRSSTASSATTASTTGSIPEWTPTTTPLSTPAESSTTTTAPSVALGSSDDVNDLVLSDQETGAEAAAPALTPAVAARPEPSADTEPALVEPEPDEASLIEPEPVDTRASNSLSVDLETPASPVEMETAPAVVDTAAEDVVCTVAVMTDPALVEPVETAVRAINAEMPYVRLVIAESGPLSIRFGGEWPADQPALGWTDPMRRSILINPDHPAVTMNGALADVITHELGHVLIGPAHVNDGTMLDSRLDGQIRIGDDDRRVLSSLSCDVLGF